MRIFGTGGRELVAAVLIVIAVTSCSADRDASDEPSVDTPIASSAASPEPAAQTSTSAPVIRPPVGTDATSATRPTVEQLPPSSSATTAAPPTSETDVLPAATAPSSPSSEQSPTDAPAGGFRSSVDEIDDSLAARMGSSWRPGCPVPLSDLRYLTLTFHGFDGADHDGELVVAADVADDVVTAFGALYAAGYPIQSMRLVDDFDGSDDASMASNNTSAFNCRAVTGGTSFSEHSYGTAVDINPVQNPYVRGSRVLPPEGSAFAERPDEPGVIHNGDAVVAAFAAIGWSWGGDWSSPTDYQHFSRSGR